MSKVTSDLCGAVRVLFPSSIKSFNFLVLSSSGVLESYFRYHLLQDWKCLKSHLDFIWIQSPWNINDDSGLPLTSSPEVGASLITEIRISESPEVRTDTPPPAAGCFMNSGPSGRGQTLLSSFVASVSHLYTFTVTTPPTYPLLDCSAWLAFNSRRRRIHCSD